MRAGWARRLTRLYPQAWRERYGEEFAALLEERAGGPGTWLDVARSAAWEHVVPSGGRMEEQGMSFRRMMKQPAAYVPLLMSVAALALVLGHAALYGVTHDADEGATAHLWQILMAGQVPLVLYFAVKWLPRAPRETLAVLAEQAGMVAASCASVYFLT